jgi:hypothetical protein
MPHSCKKPSIASCEQIIGGAIYKDSKHHRTRVWRTLTNSLSAFASSMRPSRLAPNGRDSASRSFNAAICSNSFAVKYVVGFADFICGFQFRDRAAASILLINR